MCQENKKHFETILCVKVEGIPTEFVYQRFENKHFIIVTQYQKMCNLFTVKFDVSNSSFPGLMNAMQQLTIIANFGEDKDETRTAINFIVNNSNLKNCPNEILFSLGLKDITGKILREVVEVINTFVK